MQGLKGLFCILAKVLRGEAVVIIQKGPLCSTYVGSGVSRQVLTRWVLAQVRLINETGH